MEENPKLKLVSDVLQEIRENEDNKVLGPPVTLIVCAEDRACSQLKQVHILSIIKKKIIKYSIRFSSIY